MAEGDGFSPDKNNEITPNDENELDITREIVGLDLGDDHSRKSDVQRLGNQNNNQATAGPSTSETRREDNPFSFKHFLQCDSSYQNKGARPKVYCDGRPVVSSQQVLPDNPSALPDFVQDHLVIEQCYLSNGPSSNKFNAHLPDFTQNSCGVRQNFDVEINNESRHVDFPFDLPRPVNSVSAVPVNNEVAVSKSLPDFLNDGAVRNQNVDQNDQSPERGDSDRLQRELDFIKRQLIEQTSRAELLQKELDSVKNQEHEYTQNLIKALEQVEDNLERSNRRAASAEATILKLRQELTLLKKENDALRGEEGAAGGPRKQPPSNHSLRLAKELRNAANTAEASLRQLLSGVDNLRMMASTLENVHRIEEKNKSFMNFDDSESGPAL